jgi:hypothetical protein
MNSKQLPFLDGRTVELSGKGIYPLQFGKTCEVGVSGGQLASVFNSESGQMRVSDQVGHGLTICEYLPKNSPMLLGRPNDFGTRLI